MFSSPLLSSPRRDRGWPRVGRACADAPLRAPRASADAVRGATAQRAGDAGSEAPSQFLRGVIRVDLGDHYADASGAGGEYLDAFDRLIEAQAFVVNRHVGDGEVRESDDVDIEMQGECLRPVLKYVQGLFG